MTDKQQRIIEYWYKKLGFDERYDALFYSALKGADIDGSLCDYDISCADGERNFVSFLYFCQQLKERYEQKGIPDTVLYATLSDLVRWTDIWSVIKGGLYLGELKWLCRHLDMRLFKIGDLQFYMTDKGLEIHIPAGTKLTQEAVRSSVASANRFFARFFPEYKYDRITCHSWLLDKSLEKILPETSNILGFQKMFDIVTQEKSDDIVKYVFAWDATRENINQYECYSSLSVKVKERIVNGGDFYVGLGIYEEK